MARGFESKSVADQQETAHAGPVTRDDGQRDPVRLARLRVLQLSRADVLQHLETAHAPAHRETLERALAALDAEISRLG